MNTVLIAQSIGQTFQQTAASGPLLLALGACVLAGLVSFASPCVLPLVPGFLAYVTGLTDEKRRTRIILGACLFVPGDRAIRRHEGLGECAGNAHRE